MDDEETYLVPLEHAGNPESELTKCSVALLLLIAKEWYKVSQSIVDGLMGDFPAYVNCYVIWNLV